MPELSTPKSSALAAWLVVAFVTLVFGVVIAYIAAARGEPRIVTSGGETKVEGLESSGEGVARAAPAQAEITVGVESRAAKPEDASRQNAEKAEKILAAIRKEGISEKDLQTVNVSLNPEYDYGEGGPPRVTGYIASNTVKIIARKTEQIGPVVDAAVAAGANNVQGIQFTFSDELLQKLQDEARKSATEEALRKATILAQLTKVRLGKPISILESTATPPSPFPIFAAADIQAGGGGVETPVQSGQLEVRTTITVTYEIE